MRDKPGARPRLGRFISEYGMLLVLLGLCAYYSWATYGLQHLTGAPAGEQVAAEIAVRCGKGARVLIAARDSDEDGAFAAALQSHLALAGNTVVETVRGQPVNAREALERIAHSGVRLDAIAANQATAGWPVFEDLARTSPSWPAPGWSARAATAGRTSSRPTTS